MSGAGLLDIRRLSVNVRARRRTVQALSDVDLRVDHGEVVGLVGESGGGKTMIARSIVAALPRGARATGSIQLEGREVLGLGQATDHRGRGAAMCFQNPRRALAPVRTIGRQITDRLAVHQDLGGDAARDEAIALLRQVGLRNAPERLNAYAHELSGGMSQRVMIATALACRPRLLLADEPTTGLDVTLTRDILELFRAIADEQDRGVLLVSHDIASIAEFCDRLVVLYAGSVVEAGATGGVLVEPAHPYTHTLLQAVPDIGGTAVAAAPGSMPLLDGVPTSCSFAPRCDRADTMCDTVRPSLAAHGNDRAVSCFHPLASRPAARSVTTAESGTTAVAAMPAAEPAVRVADVEVRFAGRFGSAPRRALHRVSLEVARGETLGIVGESGCGKTTLARLIVGLLRPTSGVVEVDGIDVASASGSARRSLHSAVQMVFQDPVGSLSPRRTARQAIAEPMIAAGVPAPERQRRIGLLMRRVGLDDAILERRPHELSGGQAQRVAIARALSVEPKVVVFDEPTSALDVTVQAQILELVGELAATGDRTYVFISHDLAVVRAMSDRVAVLYLGRVVEVGPTADLFASPRHPYTRALLAGAPRLGRRRGDEAAPPPVRLARELDDADDDGGCPLRPRCPFATNTCAADPPLVAPGAARRRLVACWHAEEIAAGAVDRITIDTTTAPWDDEMTDARFQISVDIGGTFVDAMELDQQTQQIRFRKASTTPAQPWRGVLDAIDALGTDLADVGLFIHGTTLGLNAVLERRGEPTGIITNEGMADIFLVGRGNIPASHMYDFTYARPPALVERRHTIGVRCRLDYRGREIEPLDEDSVRHAADHLVGLGVRSIAVCFLHSYRDPTHEQRTAEIIRAAHPDVTVSTSTSIAREYREYERTATTVLDAYIRPVFERYVSDLERELAERGFAGRFLLMRSGGGAMTADAARRSPTNTVLSGPAGGIVGGCHLGAMLDRHDLLTLDIGGTSLDACVIEGGAAASAFEAELEHYPLLVPIYDIRTIGAGGGSIAWLDGGLLKVGPRSAGADPGPVCYGRGGVDPTVTDAAVCLGYVDPMSFLSGTMALADDAARAAVEEHLAGPLGTSVEQAAVGVFDVLLARTVGAVRQITVERGHDPREFSVVAFGGAGPLIAPLLAREMGIAEVIVPANPSGFSAWGMLGADVMDDDSRTVMALLDDLDADSLGTLFTELEQEAAASVRDQGVKDSDVVLERQIELRYLGQEHALPVTVGDPIESASLRKTFEELHRARYGHAMDNRLQVLNVRVRAIGRAERPAVPVFPVGDGDPRRARTAPRNAFDFGRRQLTEFAVYDRALLQPGDRLSGPVLIDEGTATTVVHSGQLVGVDPHGYLLVTAAGGEV